MDLVTLSDKEYDLWKKKITDISKGDTLPPSLIGKPANLLYVLQMGRELGLGPAASINGIDIIKGRPSISGATMLSLIYQKHPGSKISFEGSTPALGVCKMSRPGQDGWGYEAVWTMERAQQMGIAHKDNWKKQPGIMLKWRAVSEAARFVFPDVLLNMYTPEEAAEIVAPNNFKDDIDHDYPIPPEEKEVGPKYRIQYGAKYKNKQLKDLSIEEIEEYCGKLEDRISKSKAKPWEVDLNNVLTEYMQQLENTVEAEVLSGSGA